MVDSIYLFRSFRIFMFVAACEAETQRVLYQIGLAFKTFCTTMSLLSIFLLIKRATSRETDSPYTSRSINLSVHMPSPLTLTAPNFRRHLSSAFLF